MSAAAQLRARGLFGLARACEAAAERLYALAERFDVEGVAPDREGLLAERAVKALRVAGFDAHSDCDEGRHLVYVACAEGCGPVAEATPRGLTDLEGCRTEGVASACGQAADHLDWLDAWNWER